MGQVVGRDASRCVQTPGGEGCGPDGCLFNIFEDASETHDLSASMAPRKKAMMARLAEVGKTVYQSDQLPWAPDNAGLIDATGALAALHKTGGFLVPWLE
eukprot:COSAG03_NODE_229_length_10305_cov_30.967085_2_plen_100_part_00